MSELRLLSAMLLAAACAASCSCDDADDRADDAGAADAGPTDGGADSGDDAGADAGDGGGEDGGPPRHYEHVSPAAYFNHREPHHDPDDSDVDEVEFIATHYDYFVGRVGRHAEAMHGMSHIELGFMRSVRAMTDRPDFQVWIEDDDNWGRYGASPEEGLEQGFVHYRQDVSLAVPYAPGHREVPGYREECSPDCVPPATAETEAESRAPDAVEALEWWVPNPLSEAWLDYLAFTYHQRKEWYDPDGVFWDWCAGANVQGASQLSRTHEYADIPDGDPFAHPFIHDSIAMMAETAERFGAQYPDDPDYSFLVCNTVAPFWTHEPDGPGSNQYRTELLASPVEIFFYEIWMSFEEAGDPAATGSPSDEVHLKYLRETIELSELKRMWLEVYAAGAVPSDRTKMFLLGLAYLVQEPGRFILTYRYDGLPDAHISEWMWIPAIGHPIGLPAENPPGVVDVFGREGSRRFYELASGADPGNPGSTHHLYARRYADAIVLVKLRGRPGDGWGMETATTHDLGAEYRPLRADGTLGPATSTVTLRNSEAAILVGP